MVRGLGRILEEIRLDRADINTPPGGDADKIIRMCYKRVENIIRKHMKNDGWIPVEDQLPEEEECVIVTDACGRVWCDVCYGYAEETDENPCFHKWDEGMWHCYKPDVIAWQSRPEPYQPGKGKVK